ncbi:MAG: helix-turn-helix transcriptional regulator [Bacillota bacterium]
MNIAEIFSLRLLRVMAEKNVTQSMLAKAVGCSRQSINFYLLAKRTPDVALAAEIANYLDVSCDYLIGRTNFRDLSEGDINVTDIGMTEECMQFFAGLKFTATGGKTSGIKKLADAGMDMESEILPYSMAEAEKTLKLLNDMISHDKFGLFLQYLKSHMNIKNGEEDISYLESLIYEIKSPITNITHGGKEERSQLLQDFCLMTADRYIGDISRDITK